MTHEQTTQPSQFGFSTSSEIKRTDMVKRTDKSEQFVKLSNLAATVLFATSYAETLRVSV